MPPDLRMDILRFLAIRSLLPKFLVMLSAYFKDSVYHFRHQFINKILTTQPDTNQQVILLKLFKLYTGFERPLRFVI
jgi:hypothetical protein